jgi:two-component system phosphate regulon sensor histidine kinase PhoR
MTTQRELSGRYLGQAALLLSIVAAILLPICWAVGLIGNTPTMAVIATGMLALIVGTVANLRVATQLEKAMGEVQRVLKQAEKGDHDFPLTSECHAILPDLSAALERAQAAIRGELAELSGARDRLRNVINSMAEGVIGVDSQQRILLINAAACQMFTLRESNSVGRPVWEQVRLPQLQAWVSEAVESTAPAGGELHLRSPIPRDLSLSVSAFHGPGLAGAVIVVTDVTELRRLEHVRQKFVANASHELKTPITSIQACVETLLDGAIDDVQCRDRFLQTISEQTTRLDTLVKDLLALARLESEPTQREAHPVSVEGVLRVCYERHLQTAERKGLSLSLEAIPPGLRVLAEEEALEHILDNLVDNALKYTEAGGAISLLTRQDGDVAFLEVKDTGIGIPQQHLPRIFERFYRVDRHRSREVGGTGLGLSIVKHLVQSIGGSINVNSKLHEGSTFSVKFRMAQTEE